MPDAADNDVPASDEGWPSFPNVLPHRAGQFDSLGSNVSACILLTIIKHLPWAPFNQMVN